MKSFFKSYFWLPALIGIVVYLPVLSFGTAWGDDQAVLFPTSRDFHLMLKGFYQNIPGLHFMPLHYLQCYVIHSIFGRNAFPFGFHLYQLILHAIACVLATLVLFKITKSKLTSVLIVLLWTVHPLNVEVLTRLGCAPAQVASGVFCLGFAYCLLKIREVQSQGTKLGYSVLGIFLFLASLTSYEQHFFFPIVLGLVFFFLEGKKMFQEKKCLYFFIIPIVLIYPLYLIWKYYACGGTLLDTSDELIKWTEMGGMKDIVFRALWLSPQLLVHYFRLLFCPDYLAESKADWYMVGGSVWSSYSLFCQIFILSLIVADISLYKKIPLFSIGVFWFLIEMVLVIQIIPVFTIIDEHYCYIPILGILLAIFGLVNYCLKNISPKVLIMVALPIVCLLTWRTMLYIPSAKDQLTQYLYLTKEAPQWLKAQYIARTFYYATMQNRKTELPAWLNEKTFEEEMEKWVKVNLNVVPDLSYKFGPVQMPYNYYFYKSFLKYLYDTKRIKEVNKLVDQTITIKNNWFGWSQIAEFLMYTGNWEASWQGFDKAIKLNPKIKSLYSFSFIKIVQNANKFNEAEQIIKNYIKLNPKSSYPYLFAGWFYKEFNKIDLALQYFQEAISVDKIVSVNNKDLYYQASELFRKNKIFDMEKKTLNVILSFDPFDERAKDKLLELKSSY